MVNTIWKEVFLIMCSCLKENARHSGRFLLSLRITNDYALMTLCCSPHNVCDDEGKFDGALPNRAVRNEDGKIMDIIFGPFFICDCRGEEFGSLTDEQIQKYTDIFRLPEKFTRVDGEILAVQFDPRSRSYER